LWSGWTAPPATGAGVRDRRGGHAAFLASGDRRRAAAGLRPGLAHDARAAEPDKLVDDVLKAAQSRVDELVAAYGEGAGDVSIAVEAVAGHPGDVLCDAADGAELLVLGDRGRGATAARLIGSVGLHCVLHANCPVTVVRPDA
jgi:nucleotide-binding universal stress UspA family protein